jgi:pyridoxine/pyridoxamine 5'-phosphate oxidase
LKPHKLLEINWYQQSTAWIMVETAVNSNVRDLNAANESAAKPRGSDIGASIPESSTRIAGRKSHNKETILRETKRACI